MSNKLAGLIELKGTNVHIELRDQFGKIKEIQDVHNTVTNTAKYGVADLILLTPTLAKPTHMAIGTGTPAADALGTELDRNALTSKERTNGVVTMVGDWAADEGTGTLTEAGIFNSAAGAGMWCSATIAITKGALDTLKITWTLTFI